MPVKRTSIYSKKGCEEGNEAIVKYLVELILDIHKVNHAWETPLFKVCRRGHKHIIRYLVELRANVRKVNNKGESLSLVAIKKRRINIGKYLQEIGMTKDEKEYLQERIEEERNKKRFITSFFFNNI